MYKGIYLHLKSGNPYKVIDFVINTTNKNDCKLMVLYKSFGETKTFVIEVEEFKEKFEFVSHETKKCINCSKVLVKDYELERNLCYQCV